MSRAPSVEEDSRTRKRLVGLLLVVAIGGGGVWYLLARDAGVISGEILMEARFPAAVAVLPDGTIRYGERLTGQIRDLTSDGELVPEPVAEVDVEVEGHGGLLGVAVDDEGRTFASWTNEDDLLIVAQVAPGAERVVWEGPRSTGRNIGGHIAFDPDGRLVVGVGDLQAPEDVVDPALPNGKMLALDPDGPSGQDPTTISGGWTNPYAFAFGDDGRLWIADNAAGGSPERLTRGDLDARRYPITELPEDTAPAGLAVDGEDLYVCGFTSRRLHRYRIRSDDTIIRTGAALATNCSLAVAVLPTGDLVYTNEATVFTLDPDEPAD
jgi:sugar lactone lactonase YvrE